MIDNAFDLDRIRPADVYLLVNWLTKICYLLICLVCMQILAKIIIFVWVIKTNMQVQEALTAGNCFKIRAGELLNKVAKLLEITEGHARISDRDRGSLKDKIEDVKQETRSVINTTAKELKEEVKVIPERTAEILVHKTGTGDSVH